jgi:enoyl-CoA hydratase/carnithine racemase
VLVDGPLIYDASAGVARITLNRPEALNAINGDLHRGLVEGLTRAGADPDIRAIVLRGAGRAFSAGGDVKAVLAGEDVGDPAVVARTIWSCPKPVIAAVHGYCLGQAHEIVSVCDLAVAAQSARFGEVEINHGWSPPILVTPYVVGHKHAKEILLLGNVLDAEWALRTGLVNLVVPDAELDEATAEVTTRLTSLDPQAVATNKRKANEVYETLGFLREQQVSVPGS